MKKILIVGGTFDREKGKASGVVRQMILSAKTYSSDHQVDFVNGGNIEQLKTCLENIVNYDYVFWLANVSNSEEKIRNVKDVNPKCLLVTSKRNDRDGYRKKKYSMEELLQRTLVQKANLCIEFTAETTERIFVIRVFDPLGCVWYEGYDTNKAMSAIFKRLDYLFSVTRKPSVQSKTEVSFEFTDKDREFLDFVKTSAEVFHELMCLPPDVKRFVGNASLRFKEPTRCMSGFPAIRKDNLILISRRNVDKTGISEKDFVPCYLEDDGSTVYAGENKPSVDSPVQLRLFRKLPGVDYILHGHCYIKNAPMTRVAIPCGAVEESTEVLETLKEFYGTLDGKFYILNLKGHGCLIMANRNKLDKMKNVEFYVRPLPEDMTAI